jgi:hypothetical protein
MVASFFFARQSDHDGNIKQAKYPEPSWRGKDIALTIANLLDQHFRSSRRATPWLINLIFSAF